VHLFRLGDAFALGWTAEGAAFVFLFDVATVDRAKGFLRRLCVDSAMSQDCCKAAIDMIESGLGGEGNTPA
jgi:hypothetical protein